MTTKNLNERLHRLQPGNMGQMCIHPAEGESEADLQRRIAAAGRPVVVAPKPCSTIEEWLERCGLEARSA